MIASIGAATKASRTGIVIKSEQPLPGPHGMEGSSSPPATTPRNCAKNQAHQNDFIVAFDSRRIAHGLLYVRVGVPSPRAISARTIPGLAADLFDAIIETVHAYLLRSHSRMSGTPSGWIRALMRPDRSAKAAQTVLLKGGFPKATRHGRAQPMLRPRCHYWLRCQRETLLLVSSGSRSATVSANVLSRP